MSAWGDAAAGTRLLCIAGSPRRHGNSDLLLDELTAGAQEAGATALRLVAATAGIGTCRGCNACSRDGECIQRDAMDDVYRLLDTADAIVFSSPVYFATVPAVLKTLLDRCQPYWARRHVLHQPVPEKRRPGAIIVVGGGGDPYGTACAVTPLRSAFSVLEVCCEEVLEVVGPDAAGDVSRDLDALAKAREIGRLVALAARR